MKFELNTKIFIQRKVVKMYSAKWWPFSSRLVYLIVFSGVALLLVPVYNRIVFASEATDNSTQGALYTKDRMKSSREPHGSLWCSIRFVANLAKYIGQTYWELCPICVIIFIGIRVRIMNDNDIALSPSALNLKAYLILF